LLSILIIPVSALPLQVQNSALISAPEPIRISIPEPVLQFCVNYPDLCKPVLPYMNRLMDIIQGINWIIALCGVLIGSLISRIITKKKGGYLGIVSYCIGIVISVLILSLMGINMFNLNFNYVASLTNNIPISVSYDFLIYGFIGTMFLDAVVFREKKYRVIRKA
jgi:hypothetical protein